MYQVSHMHLHDYKKLQHTSSRLSDSSVTTGIMEESVVYSSPLTSDVYWAKVMYVLKVLPVASCKVIPLMLLEYCWSREATSGERWSSI